MKKKRKLDRAGLQPGSGDAAEQEHPRKPGAQPGNHRAREQHANNAHPGGTGRQDNDASTDKLRNPGAQLGNHNALKHGFYSAIFKENERRLLAQVPLTDLSTEIELIRITNRRFLEALAASKGDLDFDTQLTALRAVNLSAHSIASLLRAHSLSSLHSGDLDAAMNGLDHHLPAEEPPPDP
jgi:hypothetical protein